MKDRLEHFIRNHRDQFDKEEPSERVWDQIRAEIPSKRRFQWIWKVAAVTFFFVSLFLLVERDWSKQNVLLTHKQKVSSDFKDIESFYFEMITEKKSLIDHYEEEIDFDYGYEQDLQNLDAMYEVLKDELRTNPSKKVVDALLLNLVVRIDILNKKLAELEEVEWSDEQGNAVEI